MLFLVWSLIAAPAGPVVVRVEARTQFVDSMLVVTAAGVRPGDQYSADGIGQAIKRLARLGLFEQVVADTARVADGVTVTFITTDLPRLKRIEFTGNRKLRTRDLTDKVKSKEGELLSPRRVFDWETQVRDLYKEKGYLLATITSSIGPADTSHKAVVRFEIDEGDRVRIRNIEIEGNHAYTDPQIEIHLTNRQKAWYRTAGFKESEFKKDLERIVDFYKERGYIDARVDDYNFSYDKGWVTIVIKITEGRRYYAGTASFAGNRFLTEEALRRTVLVKPGQPFNTKRVAQTVSEIAALYAEDGYIYTQVNPSETIRDSLIDITYQIAEGEPAHIRRVVITGNSATNENVIRREIVSMPGSVFRRSDVIRSRNNILNLGFFEEVMPDFRKADDQGDIDLVYQVKEKAGAGSIGAGVSYSQQDKLTGYIELTQPNLFGRGDMISIHLEKGGTLTNAQLGFTEPWLAGTPTAAGAGVRYLTRSYDYYDKKEEGGDIQFSRPLMLDFTRAGLTLDISNVSVTNISSAYQPGDGEDLRTEKWPKRTVSATVNLTRDSRDYRPNPGQGSLHQLQFTVAGPVLGGQVEFYKPIIESRVYFPLFWKFVLMGKARFGVVDGLRSTTQVPVYERFYPGGIGPDGVRGYTDRSLGPHTGGYNRGGRAEAILSFEWRLRINQGLAVLAFFDAGNAWGSFRAIDFSDLKRGVGLGVRFEMPLMGLLMFDVGYGLDREGGARLEPHFQIGTAIGGF